MASRWPEVRLVSRRLYRVTYEVFRYGRWERRHADTYVREEADETLQNLRDLEQAPDVQPRVRVVRATF
jgi:hypothetical protein